MRRPFLALLAALFVAELVSCGGDPPPPDTVAFVGTLIEQRFVDTDPVVNLAGADVYAVLGSSLAAQSVTDVNGGFVAGGLPKDASANLVFSDETDHVRSVFAGDTESHDSLLFYGAVFEARRDSAQSIVSEYAAAAGLSSNDLMNFDALASTANAMVRGRILRLVQTPQGAAYDSVAGAQVTVTDATGKSYRVFYRGDFPNDNDPGPIEPNRTKTGTDSRFVAFGVSAHGINALPFDAGRVRITVTTTEGTCVLAPEPNCVEDTLVVDDGITELDYFAVP